MLVSRRWLEELLGNEVSLDVDAVAASLTSLGFEVESMVRHGVGLERILVGEVRALAPHPHADRLCVVEVYDGSRSCAVVCGASNVPAPGGKVAFAPVGTVLPGGLELVEREIRGTRSHGMICAEDELAIGTDHSGILVLPDAWAAGERLVDRVPGIVDEVLDVSVTPNRPDALGHVGIARELALAMRRPWTAPAPVSPEVAVDERLVTLAAPERCGRYLAHVLDGARIGPSPLWLRVRLQRVGLRPINNAVDVTNFVLMEWGQPLHAFDRALLAEGRVVVRLARDETMRTLDGTTIELAPDDLVIADATTAQALAGIMGAERSMVQTTATELLLEAAWFAPVGIRDSARRHGFHTDSSHRFERGVDHGAGLEAAAARAVALLCELTGARVVARAAVQGQRPSAPTVVLRPERVGGLLGMDIAPDESARILAGLEIGLDRRDPARWACRPPSHRPDLALEEDLIEEVMRHHGLDALPAVASMPSALNQLPPDERARLSDDVADALVESQLHELVSFAFTEPAKLEPFAGPGGIGPEGFVRIANPMRGASVMRTHLLPGMLDALALNVARHARPVRLFEVGRVYAWPQDAPPHRPGASARTRDIDDALPSEFARAGVLVAREPDPDAAAHVVRALLRALARLGHEATLGPAPETARVSYLHPGSQARIEMGDPRAATTVGIVGEIHPDLRRRWDLPDSVRAFYGELWLDCVPSGRIRHYVPIQRHPATTRDLSLDLSRSIAAATVIEHLRAAAEKACDVGEDPPRLAPGDDSPDSVFVVEDWRGEGIGDDRRALLLRLHYRAASRTVTDVEVQAIHDAIVAAACASLASLDPRVRVR